MSLPFTAFEFFDVFRKYNEDIWPLQFVLLAAGAAAAVLPAIRRPGTDRAVATILTFLWVWMALVYHLLFFIEINRAALYFGMAFLGAGLAFLLNGVYGTRLQFEIPRDARAAAGAALIAYGLVIYPLLSLWLGHYPEVPTFGVPCPTTIFTIGLLCFLRPPFPWYVLLVPVVWTAIGSVAVIQLGVLQDLGLPAAGIVGVWLLARRAPQPVAI
jgi:FtsH-binding integral membrane protein